MSTLLGSSKPTIAGLTTLRVGGPISRLVDVQSEGEFVGAVQEADAAHRPLLILGGGSNLLAADEPFEGIVVRDRRRGIGVTREGTQILVSVPAGQLWDEIVETTVSEGWMGLEALSGIPGSAGATPVQNVGAYGREVGEVLAWVRAYDRSDGRVRVLNVPDLGLGYRTSSLKRSRYDNRLGPGSGWELTGRYVVLEVCFRLVQTALSSRVRYPELARMLQVEMGTRVPLRDLREAVLTLRQGKGMVLDEGDHDTWSAGSFFVNPVLSARDAARLLPPDAPRYPVQELSSTPPTTDCPRLHRSMVKTSAAWLISHAGFGRGYGDPLRASLSQKHVLALTNRGAATAQDLVALAREIRDGVCGRFGVELTPEPVLLGLRL